MSTETYLYQEIQLNLVKEHKDVERYQVVSSYSAYDYLLPLYGSDIEIREHFIALFLNNNNQVIGHYRLSTGGITGTVVDVRLLFATALKALAVGVIISHNHPSGKVKPSDADIQITKKIKEAGKLLDIHLLDHLIVTDVSYLSFADDGIL
ncbi:JAB domain-containing protein [Myroides odoratimimus]|uniref:JAB domain-containing protein n=1 Tax=Myroides odoratimimus TaxID=76832 RepID=UPI0025760E81|nr:JAB domain-containing protein [Myroides odoratimimus]MDM1398999.1 JAB domain-containing protein [Myroides odoratimimus]